MMQTYLGDGLYAELDNSGQVRLFTTDGYETVNEVFLEPELIWAFEIFIERLRATYPYMRRKV